jgi:hypothetical protein
VSQQGKRGGRFSYLAGAAESAETPAPTDEEGGPENADDSRIAGDESQSKTDSSGDGGGGTTRTRVSNAQELVSVPKGKGRMKQERSQLNVRIPTTLKRQASAKAILEGRDIGEVVEELLREYLAR